MKRKSPTAEAHATVADVLGIDVKDSNPRLQAMQSYEETFNRVCHANRLEDYADDIAEYITDAGGHMRGDVTSAIFAMRFPMSEQDADVILNYVRAFFELVDEERQQTLIKHQ